MRREIKKDNVEMDYKAINKALWHCSAWFLTLSALTTAIILINLTK